MNKELLEKLAKYLSYLLLVGSLLYELLTGHPYAALLGVPDAVDREVQQRRQDAAAGETCCHPDCPCQCDECCCHRQAARASLLPGEFATFVECWQASARDGKERVIVFHDDDYCSAVLRNDFNAPAVQEALARYNWCRINIATRDKRDHGRIYMVGYRVRAIPAVIIFEPQGPAKRAEWYGWAGGDRQDLVNFLLQEPTPAPPEAQPGEGLAPSPDHEACRRPFRRWFPRRPFAGGRACSLSATPFGDPTC